MWMLAAVAVAVASAVLSFGGAVYVHLQRYDTHNRLNAMESSMQSLRGKVGRWEQETRKRVVEEVEDVLEQSEVDNQGADSELMEQLLPALLAGGGGGLGEMFGGNQNQSAQPEPNEPPAQDDLNILGSGGE